jgi:aryl carrier-like protein
LGRGLRDVQVLVVNQAQTLAGIGEMGEILMRSPHLAAGYLNDPAQTQARFQQNPFTQTEDDRVYRTGDLGRYLPNGDVEFVERADNQVKIRGFRIELGEIEAVLRGHAALREAAVVARTNANNDKRLVAYVVPVQEPPPANLVEMLRQHVQTRLPAYMVPATFMTLAALPLTPNGKLDRQALPQPDMSLPTAGYIAPRTPTEKRLVELWQTVLDVAPISVEDNFFDLGGHSLLATQLLARLFDATGTKATLRMLFEAPTISAFAALLDTLRSDDESTSRSALVPLARQLQNPAPSAEQKGLTT